MRRLILFLALCGAFAIAAPAVHAATGTISGTVTHVTDGAPIASLVMSATNTTTSAVVTAVTGSDGSYSFTLDPGTYDISLYYNYTLTDPTIVFIKQTLSVTIASGETKNGQDLALHQHGRFVGHVYASDGVTPVSGATMSLSNGTSSGYGTSASDGSYILTPQVLNGPTLSAVGSFTFYVMRAGYFSAQVSNVVLTADDTDVTRDITLTPASTVSGTISDANGSAVASATVTLTRITTSPYGTTYTATTNASGVYTVSIYDLYSYNGTAVGDFTLSVSKSGYVTKTAAVSIDGDATVLTGYNYAFATAGTINGTVKNSAGNGLSGVALSANDGFGHTYSATSDSNGDYTLSSLNPTTRYTVTATKTNYVGQIVYDVTVTAGATTSNKNFALAAAKTLSGTVVAKSTNTALDGAVVSLYKRSHARTEIADFTVTTKSDGSYTFRNVSPGVYRLKIVKSGYVNVIVDAIVITSDVTGKTYKLDLGATARGRVYTGKNTGIAGANIGVYAVNNGKEVSYTSTVTDESGYYLVSGLKAGSYKLHVISSDYVTKIITVKVKTAGSSVASNIKMSAAGSVSGYLTDKVTGLPLGFTLVKVVGTSITALSDSNGYFIIDGVAPGKARVTVVNPYYDLPGQRTVSVSAGKTAAGINFSLNPRK